MKKILAICLLIMCGLALSACNTFRGFGKDVERVGETIQGK